MREDRPIAITGLKHSGKSSVAPRVARALDLPWLDLDEEALRLMKTQLPQPSQGGTLRAFYATYGAQRFRGYELKALRAILDDRYPAVIACGGGVCDNTHAFRLLEESTFIVYLTAAFDRLWERIAAGGIPPFLKGEDPHSAFLSLAQRRDELYRRVAKELVPVDGRTVAEAAALIVEAVKENSNAR